MLEEYFDDFNSLNRTSFPVGGSYFTLANRPKTLRDVSETVFCAGFCPPGKDLLPIHTRTHTPHNSSSLSLSLIDVTFAVFYDKLLAQFVEMERGWLAKLGETECFLVAGINVATQDLPQGNDKAMTKRQNAGQGCRSCNGSKEDIPHLEKQFQPRLHHQMLDQRKAMKGKKASEVANMEKESGVLADSSPFEKLSFDICKAPFVSFLLLSFILHSLSSQADLL